MPTTSRFGCCTLAVGIALAAPAEALELASISYPPQAVHPFGAATVTSVINMPNADPGVHGFYVTFVLPQDYRANAKVRIVVHLNANVAGPCTIVFAPQQLARWRPGAALLTSSAGLTPADGSNLVTFPDNNVVAKVFTVTRDPAFAGGQRPGDGLGVALGREGGHSEDTCGGTVQVRGIDIRYPRALQ